MARPAHLTLAPWRPVTCPAVPPRSPERLLQVVETFELDAGEECAYRPVREDDEDKTFCNRFVGDATAALAVPVPVWGYTGGVLREWRVLEQRMWLVGEGTKYHGWERVTDGHIAQAMADTGQVAVAVYQGPRASHGHIALVIPALGKPGVWVAQAGRQCFSRGLVSRGFGSLPVEYFTHP